MFLLINLNSACLKAQKFDPNHPAIANLQKTFNSAVSIAVKEHKVAGTSALMVADITVNNFLTKEFREAEKYYRSVDQNASMIDIDSCLQFNTIMNAITACSELNDFEIKHEQVFIKSIQDFRRKPVKSKTGLENVKLTSSLYFGSHIRDNVIDGLNVYFNDYHYFLSKKEQLRLLAKEIEGKGISVMSVPENSGNTTVMTFSFLERGKAIAQVKLSYLLMDYYGKIQAIEFIPKNKIKYKPVVATESVEIQER